MVRHYPYKDFFRQMQNVGEVEMIVPIPTALLARTNHTP